MMDKKVTNGIFFLLLGFIFINPLCASISASQDSKVVEIFLENERKETLRLSNKVDQYRQKYWKFRKDDFTGVENRTKQKMKAFKAVQSKHASEEELQKFELEYWRAKRHEIINKLTTFENREALSWDGMKEDFYLGVYEDSAWIFERIDWSEVFKPFLECAKEMDMNKCKDIEGIFKNFTIEILEKTWKVRFIHSMVEKYKVTPEIAEDMWDKLVIPKIEKKPLQKILEKSKDTLSEKGEKLLADHLKKQIVPEIKQENLIGKTEKEIKEYMEEETKKKAEERAKKIFSTTSFISDIFWKHVQILWGEDFVSDQAATVTTLMKMCREAAGGDNRAKINYYYFNPDKLKEKLRELHRKGNGKNDIIKVPHLSKQKNNQDKSEELSTHTHNRLIDETNNVKNGGRFNLGAYQSIFDASYSAYQNGKLYYKVFLEDIIDPLHNNIMKDFNKWLEKNQIDSKIYNRERTKIDQFLKKITRIGEEIRQKEWQIDSDIVKLNHDITSQINAIEKKAVKSQKVKELEQAAADGDIDRFKKMKGQIISMLDRQAIYTKQYQDILTKGINRYQAMVEKNKAFFWKDGIFKPIQNFYINTKNIDPFIIPSKFRYPVLYKNPAEIFIKIDKAKDILDHVLMYQLVAVKSNSNVAISKKEMLKKLSGTVEARQVQSNLKELYSRNYIYANFINTTIKKLRNLEQTVQSQKKNDLKLLKNLINSEMDLRFGRISSKEFNRKWQNGLRDFSKDRTTASLIYELQSELDLLFNKSDNYFMEKNRYHQSCATLIIDKDNEKKLIKEESNLSNIKNILDKINNKIAINIVPQTSLEEIINKIPYPDKHKRSIFSRNKYILYGSPKKINYASLAYAFYNVLYIGDVLRRDPAYKLKQRVNQISIICQTLSDVYKKNNSKLKKRCHAVNVLNTIMDRLNKKHDPLLWKKAVILANKITEPIPLQVAKIENSFLATHLYTPCDMIKTYDRVQSYSILGTIPLQNYDFKLNGTPVKVLQKKWKERNSIKIVSKNPVLTISNIEINKKSAKNILATELKICKVPAAGAKKIENDQYRNCMVSGQYKTVAQSGYFVEKYRMEPYQTIAIDIRIKVQTKNGTEYYKPYHDGVFVQWWDENKKDTPAVVHTQEGQATLEIFSGEGSFQDGYDFKKKAVQRISENGISNSSLKPDIFYAEKEFIESPDNHKRLKVIDYGKKAINKITERPNPNDFRFYKIDYHKSPILKGHTYAMYTKRGKLVLINIIDMYQKPYDDYHINGIKFKWKLASVPDAAKNGIKSVEKKQIQIHGKWIDIYGNKVSISQTGNKILVTALENKGFVGWEKAEGELSGNQVSINFNGQILTGKIGANNKNISWSNGVTWILQNINISKPKPADRCPSSKSKAYKLYEYAYSQLKKLMNKGQGDTKEAQNFYKKYKFYKDCYTNNSSKQNVKTDNTTDISQTKVHTTINKTNTSTSIAPDISGTWSWLNGETVHIYQNGTVKSPNGHKGTWKANWNGSGFTYTINWNKGQYIDSLVLHGDTLDGHNQNGTHVWGKRISKTIPISTNIASILPGVWSWTCCGGSYTGSFKILSVDGDGHFSGKFGDSPADGKSPLSGHVVADRIKFTRTILVNGMKVGVQQWTAKVVFIQKQWHMSEGDWTGYARASGNGGFSAVKVSPPSQAFGNNNLKPGVSSSYLGCYIDKPDRDIKGYHFNHGQMTNKICINTCREKGFGIAATQFSTHCFCGNSFGDYGKAPKQDECSYKCKGNEKTNCGGYWRNSVYQIEEGGFPGVKVPPPSQPSGNSTTTGNTHSKPGVSSFKTQYGEINPNGEITITTFHTSPKGVNNIAYTSIVVKDENNKVYIQDPYKTNNNPASKRKKPIPSNHFGVYPTEKMGYTVRDLIDAGINGTVKSVSTRYSKILSGSNAKVIGDKLKVILHLKLNNLPAGKKYIYARTVDLQSVDSGWKKVGEFTVIENTASPMANSDTQSNKPVSITQTLRCPSSQQQAYRLYTNNYNELQKLMLQGHGDIPEAQVFYKKYKFYKDCYELPATQLDHESDGTVSAAVSDLTATTPILSQTVYASADAYVYAYNYRNWNRSNRGRYDQLVAGWHPTGGESRAYINFDLSGIGKSKISKAILKLYHFQTSGNNDVELGIYRVTSPWNEGSNTYHSGRKEKTAPPGDISWVQQPKIDAAPITTFNPGTGMRDWTKINITSLVKQWLSDTPNYGIVIKPIGHLGRNISVSTYHFASRERDQNFDKPKGENKSPVLILSRERKADSAIRGNGKSKQKQLYQEYIKAYNELHTTMQEGRGDISQAQKIYKNAKDRYNSFLERRRRQ